MIADAALKQLQVINALTLRETRTRFGQHQLGYLWAVVQPLIWIGTFYAIWTYAHRRTPSGMDMISFLATGFMPYLCFMNTLQSCANAINGNKPLLFFPQVHTLDLIASRAYLEFSTYMVVFTLIMGGRALVTGRFELESIAAVVGGFVLACLLGAGVGLVFCTVGIVNNAVERVRGVMFRPLFWMSGLFYTVDTLPLRLREFLWWNPALHVVELVRDGWHGCYTSPVVTVWYVLVWILGFFFVGLTLERRLRHRIHTA